MTATRTRAPAQADQREPQRRRRRPRDHDVFYIDRKVIPRGQDWQWNRISTMNEPDRENQIDAREAGWEPVTYREVSPEMRPVDLTDDGLNEPVVRRGQMLMKRPLAFTLEARAEDLDAARDAVATKQKQLGQPTERGAPKQGGVSRTFERPQIPAVAEGHDVE